MCFNIAVRNGLLLFFLLVGFVSVAQAQDCTKEALAQKPGAYRASTVVGSTPDVSRADLAREKAVLEKVHQIVTAGYTPMGVVAQYITHFDGGYENPERIKVADTFGYSLYLLKYNCDTQSADKSQFYINAETPTILNIDANVINRLRLLSTDIADNSFRGYLLMAHRPTKVDGFYYLGNEFMGNTQSLQKEYTWVITYDDTLPFTYVTRKEFLLLSKARLEKTIQEDASSVGYYDQYMNRINEALQASEADLSQEAIINRSDEERFTGFLEEGEPMAYFAVKHNPAYYRKGLPLSAPQFFTVTYNVLEGDEFPVYAANMNAVKQAVDFAALRDLLGK